MNADELNILDQIENVSSKKQKETILKAAVSDRKLSQLLDAAFNFKRKFFIKKFDIHQTATTTHDDKHYEFLDLLSTLESEVIRGDAAKAAVEGFMDGLSIQQQKWYSRVLKKDLKAGFSISTSNKAGFNIPRFEVMLAKDGKISKKLDEMINTGGYVSKKFDGYRCLTEVVDGKVTMYSRNGTIYDNFPTVEKALQKAFPKGKHVFDGEIMSDDFQAMQRTAFAGKKGRQVGDVKYCIFDCIPYHEWIASSFKAKKSDRITWLKLLTENMSLPSQLEIVEQKWVNSMDEIKKLERSYISQGFEGAMFLPDISYYLGKKSNKMLKFKTMLSQDVEVVGFYNGDADSKYKDSLGGVTVKQEDGIECDCGSGFTDFDRDYIWNHQKEFVGRIFEAKYQELGSNGKMRFPVFTRWRDLKADSGKI